MEAIVLLADVRGSRKTRDRRALARKLRVGLRRLNAAHSAAMLAPFEIQKGVDEFAALLRPGHDVGSTLVDLWSELHPARVRHAVVRGALDVVPRGAPKSVRLFDGPAFHQAAQLLDSGVREGLVALRLTGHVERDAVLEALANALYLHVQAWTPRQLEIVRAYRALGSQEAVARRMRITQPTVSAALGRAGSGTLFKALDQFVRAADAAAGLAR